MAKYDDTYQNSKVYLPQDANVLAIDDDGFFGFSGGTTVSGAALKAYNYTNNLIQTVATSAGSLSVVNLPSGGTVFISASVGVSNASAWLTSCSTGARLRLVFRLTGGVDSVGSVFVSLSGVSLVGLTNQDLSSISLNTSAASAAFLELLAISDNEWAVVEENFNSVTERASA